MSKRKTKLAQADGWRTRFRSAWKKTTVPAAAASTNAIRKSIEDASIHRDGSGARAGLSPSDQHGP
jgi:hypothetical protein